MSKDFTESDPNFNDFRLFFSIWDAGGLQNHPKTAWATPGDPESSPKTSWGPKTGKIPKGPTSVILYFSNDSVCDVSNIYRDIFTVKFVISVGVTFFRRER